MCGRYSLTTPSEAMRRLFGFVNPLANLPPRYNIAPTQAVPVVRLASRAQGAGGIESGERELVQVRWGLIPFWAKDASIGAKTINARAEGIAGKPAFRAAFKSRRCLIPADGFYEWLRTGTVKQPFCFEVRDGELFAFAGLWERWRNSAGEWIRSCSILTTTRNAVTSQVHDRMPVILDKADYELWLDPGFTDVPALHK
jgi:putative SOS response-associated peptidase YedK